MATHAMLEERTDFSLVLGGPVYQLFRRAHLSGDELELSHRRNIVIASVAWAPLLVLSALGEDALAGAGGIPFLYDIETHVRFLIALPLLISAERVVHLRIRPVVLKFLERRIISPEDMPKFHAAIDSTMRLRNSVVIEVALLALVYALGPWIWQDQFALGTASWYAIPDAAQLHLTPAGYWLVFLSLPIFQFILLRWYLRFFLWFWFLFRVSKLNLRLIPTHPDRTAGLNFVGASISVFAPILLAQGAALAGVFANQIFHGGQNLLSFKVEIVSFLASFIVVMLIPVTVFAPNLVRAKRQGSADFGRLASRYAKEFEEKWLHDAAPADEALLGSADIQSLADLGNSFTFVQEMRFVPFGLKDVTRLAAIAAVPFLPLTLTVFSVEELVGRLIKVLF